MNINNLFKLFRTKESEAKIFLLIENAKQDYLVILKNISVLLRNENFYAQAEIVENLTVYLLQKDYNKFEKEINSVNMWGGSGAVWEVSLPEKSLQQKFNIEMLALINLMEKTKILGGGIKPLKKLFKQ